MWVTKNKQEIRNKIPMQILEKYKTMNFAVITNSTPRIENKEKNKFLDARRSRGHLW